MGKNAGGWEKKMVTKTRAILAERFPKCFAGSGQPKRPLKIGIHTELSALCKDIPAYRLRMTLKDYTMGISYQAAIAQGKPRVDLDGNECGAPDAAAVQYALTQIAKAPDYTQIKWYGELVPVEIGTQSVPKAGAGRSGA